MQNVQVHPHCTALTAKTIPLIVLLQYQYVTCLQLKLEDFIVYLKVCVVYILQITSCVASKEIHFVSEDG